MADTREQLISIAAAFGLRYKDGMDLYGFHEKRKELDFLTKMDKNDPPIFVYNKHKSGIPANQDDLNHHPIHAKIIKEKAEEAGLEAIVYAPEIGIVDSSGKDLVQFFIEKFF